MWLEPRSLSLESTEITQHYSARLLLSAHWPWTLARPAEKVILDGVVSVMKSYVSILCKGDNCRRTFGGIRTLYTIERDGKRQARQSGEKTEPYLSAVA